MTADLASLMADEPERLNSDINHWRRIRNALRAELRPHLAELEAREQALLARVAELERVAEASAIAIQDRDDRIQELRVRGAELEGALRQIAGLDPEDSSEGRNEWGEAEMFEKAQEIAREELAREDI